MVGLCTYLRGHDQLMIYDIVRCEPHTVESTGGVKVTGHATTTIDILPNTLPSIIIVVNTLHKAPKYNCKLYNNTHMYMYVCITHPWNLLRFLVSTSNCYYKCLHVQWLTFSFAAWWKYAEHMHLRTTSQSLPQEITGIFRWSIISLSCCLTSRTYMDTKMI